jgi:hypothetical protein
VKRARTISAIVSAILCGLLVIIYAISFRLDYRKQGVTVTSSFHVGFFDGSVYFYSLDHPYLDGIYSLSDTNSPSPVVSGWHIGDYYCFIRSSSIVRYGSNSAPFSVTIFNLPGTRFREISSSFENRLIWTFELSLWYPILLLTILPALWIYRRRHLRFEPTQ